MTKPLTAETFITWMWAHEYQFDSKADHSAFRNRFSRQIARLNEDAYRTDQPRPLTPDAITDELVGRARIASHSAFSPGTVRRMLAAALTEPPARPEGAEDIEALVEKSLPGDALSDAQVRALADFLAERGVRVTGGN